MAKSTGNIARVGEVLAAGVSAAGAPARADLGPLPRAASTTRDDSLAAAGAALDRLDAAVAALGTYARGRPGRPGAARGLDGGPDGFGEALDDDLNVSAGLAVVFDLVRDLNRRIERRSLSTADAGRALDALRDLDRVLGVLPDADATTSTRRSPRCSRRASPRGRRATSRRPTAFVMSSPRSG